MKRRIAGKTTCVEVAVPSAKAARHNPFGEFQEDGDCDDFEALEASSPHEEVSGSSGSSKNSALPSIGRTAKHAIASAKLQQAKTRSDEAWEKHLCSSARVAQMLGSEPALLEEGEGTKGTARFTVHSSHLTMAMRSIVFCKACGYLGS